MFSKLMNRILSEVDPQMAAILEGEMKRQQTSLVMIPSENYASRAVLQTQGCIMTNKYAEGYPGARYYNGCQFVDMAESLAIERAKKLFGAEHVNVQPHTGSQANMSVYYALLNDGDTFLAMEVNQGGHLSHGRKQNFSGHYYNPVFYGVERDTERIDMNHVLDIAMQCKPKLIVVGASAYPRTLDFKEWREVADKVGALLMADVAHIIGLIAGGVHPDPMPYCDVVTTTTHKTLRGPRGAMILCKKEFAEKIDKAVFPGIQAGPLMHIIAAKAVALKEALEYGFREYQAQIVKNAKTLADCLMKEGFRLVSGGTDNHLMLVDLSDKDVTGQEAADLLEESGVIINKNLIPYDTKSATQCSGIRPGTPAITTREMREPEMDQIGMMISRVLKNPKSAKIRSEIRQEVMELCRNFPIYQDLEIWR
jgi:glycine hydroxymethyltransferase